MTSTSEARNWMAENEVEHPYKESCRPSPLRSIPGGDHVSMIKVDLMHSFHIGVGGDWANSTIVGLARMRVFGEWRKLQNCNDLWMKRSLDLKHGVHQSTSLLISSPLSSRSSKCNRPLKEMSKYFLLLVPLHS